jgi:hypothetical protein
MPNNKEEKGAKNTGETARRQAEPVILTTAV